MSSLAIGFANAAAQCGMRSVLVAGVVAQVAANAVAGDATVYFVRADAPPGGNGLSWETAFGSLETALDVADPNGSGAPTPTELWVASGTYKPEVIYGGDPRNRSFYLANNVAVLGGFTGDETSADQRDPDANVTILSGDINVPGDFSDNCFHLVRAVSFHNATAVLDGFTITGANANGGEDRGAGIHCEGAPAFQRCRIVGNFAQWRGAGAYVTGGASFVNCAFEDNTGPVQGAGALHSTAAQFLTLTNCAFENNSGNVSGAISGGFNATGCVFIGNTGGNSGAANAAGTFRGCLFQDNVNVFNGGGALGFNTGSAVVIVDCDFIGNSGGGNNGGAIAAGSTPSLKIYNCRFLGNSIPGGRGGGLWIGSSVTTATVAGCVFVGNTAALGGGLSVESGNGSVVNCTVAANTATSAAGGLRFEAGSKVLRNSILWGNMVGGAANQAAQYAATTPATIQRCCVQGWDGSLGGVANIGLDPLMVNPAGNDLIAGTDDDDVRLSPGSPCIDSGDNTFVPADGGDVDLNGNVMEPLPQDIDGLPRFFDDPRTPDDGVGTPPIVDRGASEFDGPEDPIEPGTYIGPTNGSWFTPGNWAGGATPDGRSTVTIPTAVIIDGGSALAASVEIQGGGALVVEDGSLTTSALLVRAGAMLRLDHADALVSATQMLTEAGATLDWLGGTIVVEGGTWTSGIPIGLGCADAAASLRLESGAQLVAPDVHVCEDGRIEAHGTVVSAVLNDGVVAPGGSIGTLLIVGDYTQGAEGTLEIEAPGYDAGIDLDLLVVQGAAILDGACTVVADGIVPTLGGVQRFLEADSVTGAFAVRTVDGVPTGFIALLAVDAIGVQLTTSLVATAPRLFVDDDGPAGGDGQSWTTAVRSLEGALTVAASLPGAVNEIWIAAGTYVPSRRRVPADPRSASFDLVDGVAIYGGFAGDERSLEERDPVANPTVLSGDLDGNDVFNLQPGNATLTDNAHRVIRIDACGPSTRLDGVEVSGGNAVGGGDDDSGGGVDIVDGGPILANLTVRRNRAFRDGGGIRVRSSEATIQSCAFVENAVIGNQQPTHARGAAIFMESAAPSIIDCDFSANSALSLGSGLAIFAIGGNWLVEACDFHDHVGVNTVRCDGEAVGVFVGCTFTANTGGGSGRAIFAIGGSLDVDACSFVDNTNAGFGGSGGAVALSGGNHAIDGCTFTGNRGGDGGAMRLTGGDGLGSGLMIVSNCEFQGNLATGSGGAVSNDGAFIVTYDACSFVDNEAALDGGAIHNEDFIQVAITGCTITGNSAAGVGGGIHHANDGKVVLSDTTLSGNVATQGGGIYNQRGLVAGSFSLLDGDDLFNASGLRPGETPPGPIVGAIAIDGDFRHAELEGTGTVTPTLVMEIAGRAPGVEHDVLNVGGAATIDGGTLIVNFASGFTPDVGETFDLISASSVTGTFDAVGVAGAVPGISVELSYDSRHVSATVVAVKPPIFSDPLITEIDGLPRDAVAVDVDLDGDLDLALAVEGPATAPGKLLILRNQGVDRPGPGGVWLGFEDVPLATAIADEPTAITAGDLNGDGLPELVLANESSATISVVLNFGGSLFLLDANTFIGGQAASVGIGTFVGASAPDVAVANQTDGTIEFFETVGAGLAFAGQAIAGDAPRRLRVADIDLDGDDDLVVANTSDLFDNPPPLLTIHRAGPEGLLAPESYTIGRRVTGLELGAVDLDTLPDIVTANRLDSSLSVVVADPAAPGLFQRPVAIALTGEPFSITALDMDADGDSDVAAVIKRPDEAPVLVGMLNDTREGGAITFVEEGKIGTDDTPELVFHADVDDDGFDDLIVISYLGGETLEGGIAGLSTSRVRVLLSKPTVLGDLSGDGIVDGADLGLLLAAWGTSGGPADLDNSGLVDGGDLGLMLASWGA